jgi:uncharacterized protein (DUF427 family)
MSLLSSTRPTPDPAAPGQESVWAYPRPPRVEPTARLVRITFNGELIAESRRALRVLETASPPVYYLPPTDVRTELLRLSGHTTVCEWKGSAEHFDLVVGAKTSPRAAWSYARPNPGYEQIANYLAFYPGRVDEATVDGERVRPQPGGYYGGWVTDEIVGPWKGDPGTGGW